MVRFESFRAHMDNRQATVATAHAKPPNSASNSSPSFLHKSNMQAQKTKTATIKIARMISLLFRKNPFKLILLFSFTQNQLST